MNGLICDGARGPRLNALDLTVSTMHAEAMQSSASRHLKQATHHLQDTMHDILQDAKARHLAEPMR